ncbi:hypothetical protein PJI19_29055, partial [Mycobacterium kansasii]
PYFFPLFFNPAPPNPPFCDALARSSFSAFSSSFFFWRLALSTSSNSTLSFFGAFKGFNFPPALEDMIEGVV